LYPSLEPAYQKVLTDASLSQINDQAFRRSKEYLGTALLLLQNASPEHHGKTDKLMTAILDHGDLSRARAIYNELGKPAPSSSKGKQRTWSLFMSLPSLPPWIAAPFIATPAAHAKRDVIQAAHDQSLGLSDPEFMELCRSFSSNGEFHHQAHINDAQQHAYRYLKQKLDKVVSRLQQKFLRVQSEDVKRQLEKAHASEVDEGRSGLQRRYLSEVEQLSNSDNCKTYVDISTVLSCFIYMQMESWIDIFMLNM
jgi:hypothetical protein